MHHISRNTKYLTITRPKLIQADIQVNQVNSEETELTAITNQENPEKVSRKDEYQNIRNEDETKFQCKKCDVI